jgi:catechol 2,3-dioxygenase
VHDDKIEHALKVLIAARLAEGRHVGSGEGWGGADDRVKETNLARLATDRDTERAEALLTEMVGEARKLVEKYWPDIEELAEQLLIEGRVNFLQTGRGNFLQTGRGIKRGVVISMAATQAVSRQGSTLVDFFQRNEVMSTIPKPVISNPRPIEPGTSIGHVHLKVSDLNRAIAFYGGVLGFDVMQRYGDEAAFLSAGGYHHHIGLNTWESKGGSPPDFGTTGLYHFAIRYPTRRALANALRRLIDAGISIEGASDHGVSEALYLRDPDGNGIELSWDRPHADWPLSEDGRLNMDTRPLSTKELLREAPVDEP